ncbi:putative circularly permuted ATP-grasp superfamily protein [Acidovorax sp. 69]|uniref:circularly permuted type 2 ATP-grasp protein n=1 Tax=Acidovorax sp. 69 TaxID=2035202 RepID=UPI000C2496A9|nr:circularly permuted type 2 ATP-grasp protein [Acidovorax sp. 69]PJI96378.1 putative circularly permuted ATP-grasp superfamily protein [Acidovorax sp. 69]
MTNPKDSLLPTDLSESAAQLAAALAPAAASGHFDELRGASAATRCAPSDGLAHNEKTPISIADSADLTSAWADFFDQMGPEGFQDLDRRMQSLQRQVRDNGVTYNVYADADGPQRPWSVDLFPLILSQGDWAHIERGVQQRARLLDRVMADVYGPQELLRRGLLPSALVQGHPGYLRAMHGVQPVGGTHLHIAAFDMARDAQGDWWVVTQRTQAPSGLGYLLENRLLISRLFPEAFRQMHVQRLAATYRALLDGLRKMSPVGPDARIVLLTPGPYNETYFEHAYLARYLGLTLVEGSDLTVRDAHLYLKTLHGLQPVHGILKRLDDEFLDPLELRSDSRLGVPGLLQAIRAGNVLVANAPGSAFLESSALQGFMPALSRHLLGEELALPSLPTWWCGERTAMQAVLPQLAHSVIRPTWPIGQRVPVLGRALSTQDLAQWSQRIQGQGDEYTVQAHLPLSQMPTWQEGPPGHQQDSRIAPRSVMLRVFAVSDGPGSWQVLPGGLARIAAGDSEITSMQRGGSSADVWVLTDGPVDTTTLLAHNQSAPAVVHRSRQVTSRAAENLFWLGRYTERTENVTRLARTTLQCLNGEDQSSQPLLAWLNAMAVSQGLVLPSVPPATQARRVFERSLIAGLTNAAQITSVGYNLRGIVGAASAVRDRLSQEHWNLIVRADAEFFAQRPADAEDGDFSPLDALRQLETLSGRTAAMTGQQTDRMTRDDGWRLLSIGRHLERLGFLAAALESGLQTEAVFDESGFEAMLALFDSTITFHAQYQQRRDMPALLDLLVIDRDNPRSLAWVAQTLRGRIAKIEVAAGTPGESAGRGIPEAGELSLVALCAQDTEGRYAALEQYLGRCVQGVLGLSDVLATRYFTHSADALRHSVGA